MTIEYNKNFILIIFITLIYSFVVGSGFYGYGHDYYQVYINENVNWGNWQDNLGYKISTFTILEKNLGVHIVSAILAFSSGIFIKNFLISKKIYSTIYFFLIYILVLHTWPIIMSTSNAMRQGITMSLIFLCFANMLNQKYLIALILITTSIFTHKSGLFYLYIFFIILFLKILSSINIKKYFNFFLLISIIFFIFATIYLLRFTSPIEDESRVISADFRYPFLLISLIFIFIFTLKNKSLISNDINLFMYLFSILTIPILFLGYNWQYERFMMMMIIPYLLIFSTLFNRKYSKLLLIVSFSLLLSLTIFQGMYSSLK